MAFGYMRAGGSKKLTIRTFAAETVDSNTTQSVDIDVTSVPNYQDLTVDNFYILQCGFNPRNTTYSGVIRRTYNPSTGRVTVTESAGGSVSLMNPIHVVCVTME